MPDFIIVKGYTGPNLAQAQAQTKDVPIMVNGGVLGVARPTLTGADKSVATSTTAAVLMAANLNRMGFYVKNDTAIDVWINIGGTATAVAGAGNIKIPANGGYFESGTFTPSEAISIIAASGTPAITAREY
jgi:hypothetical protein